MITEQNYSPESMKYVTQILGYGVKKRIMESLGIDKVEMDNVWRGRTYKKEIVDAIVSAHKRTLRNYIQISAGI